MRAIIAGGGTGGHVIPALAIAHELRAGCGADVMFIGTARGIETRLVPAAGYDLKLVEVGALKRVSWVRRLRTLAELPMAVVQSAAIIRDYRPQIVIGVGGYASGPAMLAAVLASVPTLVFEPNVVPGFANRVLASMVSQAAVHFAETCRYFRRCVVTGVPVRPAFLDLPPKSGGPPTLLVFGGSQGAHALNAAVLQALPALSERFPGLRLIHQTGERDYNDARAAYLNAAVAAEVAPFIDNMPEMFARADLLLCRSGASTVAEVTAAGKPAIFVPYPFATDDHQSRNAEALVRAGAALLLRENELSAERLLAVMVELLNDRRRLERMSAAARSLAHADAARTIAQMAAKLAA